MSEDVLDRARSGDESAFRALVEPHEVELRVHCYRMLGSLQDAEDALQESMLAAWQGLRSFEGRASVRTWLYRITTNRCLNALRSRRRRPDLGPMPDLDPPPPTRLGEVPWLEPFPDVLLGGPVDDAPGPEARVESREAISLAFVTALQHLPPRQRAVLVLRDVLGYRANEVATMLEVTEESVTSALKRARSTLTGLQGVEGTPPRPAPTSDVEAELLDGLADALDRGDVDRLVELVTEDIWLTMPPLPGEYQGRDAMHRFFTQIAFREGRTYRSVPTRANGQPALATYLLDPVTGLLHANGLLVLTLVPDGIAVMTRFESSVFASFGLPRTLDA